MFLFGSALRAAKRDAAHPSPPSPRAPARVHHYRLPGEKVYVENIKSVISEAKLTAPVRRFRSCSCVLNSLISHLVVVDFGTKFLIARCTSESWRTRAKPEKCHTP
ncbi:hypothetical protein EVAR_48386_1 [Eumeta japonica]|uniref:Uncharacterized protein n=1 Tax=Eumeta variegata TaxID=151549 RepID=A0A4C1ZDL8_EUMVA|nr:hypothetical protein EVAR_48386_1 [Eumeta japonica]